MGRIIAMDEDEVDRMEDDVIGLTVSKDKLADALHRVLYCPTCKGKGTIFRRNTKDQQCDCRTAARETLFREA